MPAVSAPRTTDAAPWWLVACAVLAAALFVWRGPVRALDGKDGDFALVWMETRGFVEGRNPYDASDLEPLWERENPDARRTPYRRGDADLLYPPSALVVMTPWALLPYPAGRVAWALAGVVGTLVILHASTRLAGLPPGSRGWWAFAALGLAFAPVHTAIAVGQTAIVPAALVLGGHWLRTRGRPRGGGVLIGVGAALKPQVAVPFIVLELWQRRFGPGLVAAAVFAGILGAGVLRLEAAGVDWSASLRANLHEFTTANDGDPTAANPVRHEMIDLRPLLHDVLDGREVVAALAWGVTALCAAAFFLPPRPEDRRPDRELLAIGAVGTLGLMLVYHRFYDAVILLPLLAWGCAAATRDRLAAGLVLAPLLVFMVPGASLLFVLAERGIVPEVVTELSCWDPLILRHQAWTILLLAILLAVVRRRTAAAHGDAATA